MSPLHAKEKNSGWVHCQGAPRKKQQEDLRATPVQRLLRCWCLTGGIVGYSVLLDGAATDGSRETFYGVAQLLWDRFFCSPFFALMTRRRRHCHFHGGHSCGLQEGLAWCLLWSVYGEAQRYSFRGCESVGVAGMRGGRYARRQVWGVAAVRRGR